MTDLHDLITRMADELDHYRQLVTDDRREVHPLAMEARTALAQPEPEVADGPAVPDSREPASVAMQPSDKELLDILADSISEACECSSIAIDEYESETECAVEAYGSELIAFARAVLARYGRPAPVLDGEVGELVADLRGTARGLESHSSPHTATLLTRAADLLEQRQAVPVPDDRGVLPMIISKTGAADEPELERIICAAISGGADYVNNMPRELVLERITPEGSTFERYIQADVNTHSDVRPAHALPLPSGEVVA